MTRSIEEGYDAAIFAEFTFRNAVNRLVRLRKSHSLNTLTVRVVARDEARTRRLTATKIHSTSPQGEQSSIIAVAEVRIKNPKEKQSEIGPEKPQQKG